LQYVSRIEEKSEEIESRKLGSSLVFGECGIASLNRAEGTVPRSAADQYYAHAERDGIGIGRVLLSSERVRKTFVFDVDHCFLVIELRSSAKKTRL
jgi:hypothetical protein